ncbi:serine threonine protein partial : Serine/threonine protein kinase OS=Singulisphaera acidiphila (strain ATCC BAA-1392 / DSM 18658 / VKM B-2454 / MOB10) GN=Sinac_4756 PE=3 SV=1: HDOD: Pkinase [Gemmataceae bacterium]|nr:serine threonine protein partial : Serine/threonine protein kinase OS=Singulisphaera acidiphila (strain ATCC BAA-1392 / DSM 18658 / VKM B-2454 / MOB10) GN=Sinac_4756 PE=3 SV=1: HDOD: Pkinase [Gemmataceae bacterium]VTT97865.1 serine threonine protein partial : Serine/threonine protein kinase OS=Singulisphaera acidiphila (strain ATCC BAA-1392 / DSM 18658 / VKM B-2454 / MOB10) GN=Sinac_4756 PE=3 SV=1: HDOD: Pkinase [Gemmataceae bacterium]
MFAPPQPPPPFTRNHGASPSSAGRAALAAVLDPARLPTPPAVALQVVTAASRPDCDPGEIVALIGLDPALCAKLLKAVNSCLYGLSRPVSSVSRAVAVLGLSTVRSLVLGLSLPAVRAGGGADAALQEYWVSAVAGGIFARELAVRTGRPAPEDDLIAGLLQDLGAILLRRAYPAEWTACAARPRGPLTDPCDVEEEVFGLSHAEVTAELLRGWNLPDEVVEPIRYHHRPFLVAGGNAVVALRAELLNFVGHLTQLDQIAHDKPLLERVLATAEAKFGLTLPGLVKFLEDVAPKVEAFSSLLDQDVAQRPDFATVLVSGTEELVKLTVETSRDRLSGGIPMTATRRVPPAAPPPVATARTSAPEFRPEYLDRLPSTGCRFGEYELWQQLGRGGMGVVFKAFEPALDRFVAVKMLAPALAASDTARQRFLREARAAASIQHENVVAIHAVGEAAGIPYLAMEHVRGTCLENYVEERGPLSVPVLTSVSRQVAAGLAAAHLKRIVHRDMKPGNVLFESDTGRAKISDFGLARVSDDRNLTAVGALVGTPFYMAPEVIEGAAASPASDLFGLGGLLYAVAVGRPPFAGQTVAAVFRSVCETVPTPPRQIRPDLPVWFEEMVLQLLAKNPRDRITSAGDVAELVAARSAPEAARSAL